MDNSSYRYNVDPEKGVTACIVNHRDFEELVEDYALNKVFRIIANNKARRIGLSNLAHSVLNNYVKPAIEKAIGGGDAHTLARCNYEKEEVFDEEYGMLLAARRMDLLVARTALNVLDTWLQDIEFIETAIGERGYNIENYMFALKRDLKELTMDPVEEETSNCGSCEI